MMQDELKAQGFKLGGSRRMAEKFPDKFPNPLKADWDFYGQDTADNRAFLTKHGFVVVPAENRTYWDDLLVDIFKSDMHPDIEVLLRSDADGYSRAFESIPVDEYINRLWKSAPHINTQHKLPFRASVCAYFNALFNIFGCVKANSVMTFDAAESHIKEQNQ